MSKLPKHKLLKYYLAIILTYIIWSAAGPVVKITLEYIPPFTFLLLRFIIVCVLLLPLIKLELKKTHIHPQDLSKLIILGIFAQSSIAIIFLALNFTSALEAAIIGVLGPILTIFAGHYFFNEKITRNIYIGLSLAIIGTLYVALKPILELEITSNISASHRLLGNFLTIIYSLSFVLYMVWSKFVFGETSKHVRDAFKLLHMKSMKKKYSPSLLTAFSFYVGLLTTIPLAIMEQFGFLGAIPFSYSNLSLTPVLGILYMAIFSSIVAYNLFEWGLTKVEVKDTAIFKYLDPIFALPFAFILLGEVPTPYMLIGGTLIALGVMIAEYKRK